MEEEIPGNPVPQEDKQVPERELKVKLVRVTDDQLGNKKRPSLHGRAAMAKLPGGKKPGPSKDKSRPATQRKSWKLGSGGEHPTRQHLEDPEKYDERDNKTGRLKKGKPKSPAEAKRLRLRVLESKRKHYHATKVLKKKNKKRKEKKKESDEKEVEVMFESRQSESRVKKV